MNVHPILATLRRHKTAAGLIALEIALSCAIVSNAVFLIGDRLDRIRQPSGLAEAELVHFQLVGITRVEDPEAQAAEDMAALRAVPGVRSVATVNQIPFGNSSWYSSLNLEPEQQNPTMQVTTYVGSEDLLETMGLSLVSGRDFVPEEYVEFQQAQSDPEVVIPAVIVSRAVADRLFPGENPLGRSVYVWGAAPQRIVGVVEHLAKPNDIGGPSSEHTSVLMPVSAPVQYGINYLVRVDAGRRDGVLEEGVAALEAVNPSRIVLEDRTRTFEAFRDDYFQDDRAMAWLLVGVCVALLVVTALGIVGLASFWVQQRTRQIGIRRALGATRGQIIGYFQTENFLIATIGIAAGMVLAYAINGALMGRYELPRLPWYYLPLGAVVLWTLGQLSVLGPALRAAAVPPAVATRSV